MGFDYWLEICDKFANGSKEREDALVDLVNSAKTFKDWRNVFFREYQGSVHEKMALLQMGTWARTFGQWLNVYQECIVGEAVVKEVALAQLMKLAVEPCDVDWTKSKDSLEAIKLFRWEKIFAVSPQKSETELCAARRIIELRRAAKEKESEKQADGSMPKI